MKDYIEILKLLFQHDNVFISSLITIILICLIVYIIYVAYNKCVPLFKKIMSIENKKKRTERQNREMNRKLDILADNISKLSNDLESHIENSKLDTQAIMKAQLMQIFHEVHRKGYIIECDSETFEDVMNRYENAGGNGHMHTIVQPYIEEMSKNHMFQSEHEALAYKEEHGHF